MPKIKITCDSATSAISEGDMLYVLIIDRIIPGLLSAVLTILCAGMMIFSMVMYFRRNWNSIKDKKGSESC